MMANRIMGWAVEVEDTPLRTQTGQEESAAIRLAPDFSRARAVGYFRNKAIGFHFSRYRETLIRHSSDDFLIFVRPRIMRRPGVGNKLSN